MTRQAPRGHEKEPQGQKTEVLLQQIYDNVKDVLFVIAVDESGQFRFESINRRFTEATGLAADLIIGKSVAEVIPEPSCSMVLGKYREAIENRKTACWEETTEYPTGRKIGEVTVSPVFDSDGMCRRLVGTVHDITERTQLEESLRSSEKTFRLLFETSRDAIMILTPEHQCIRANPAAVSLFGCSDEQALLALAPGDRFTPVQPNGKDSLEWAREITSGESELPYAEWTYKRLDGSEFTAEVMFAHIDSEQGRLIQVSLRDITEKKTTDARLQRTTQLYAALSQCNQAIIQCPSEQELLDRVCEISVVYGGMTMAWIGMLDETTSLIRPKASFGSGTEYLKGIEVSVDPESATGRGPGGTAVREECPVWCQDFMQDPTMDAWHARGREFGWGSVAGLPLFRKQRVVGVFLLYSEIVNAFDERIQRLLIELAGDISYALGHLEDEREREKEQLQLRKLSQAVEQSHSMIVITDRQACIEYVNPAFQEITGYRSDEVVGKDLQALLGQKARPSGHSEIWPQLSKEGSWQGEVTNYRKDGTEYISYVRISPMGGTLSEPTHFLGVGEDITERKTAESRIKYLANFDALTGLPNRNQLTQRFNYALSVAKRNGSSLALMFLDLDGFKNINDTLGHGIGDNVLKETALRLQNALRQEDIVARLGGDEFILMLSDADADTTAEVAQKILEIIAAPYRIQGREIIISASIGITLYPDDGGDLEVLSKNADMAMYLAKREGRGCYRFYTEEMQVRTMRYIQLVDNLRHALANNQFTLHYQPQIRQGRIIGSEALLRWNHPGLGTIAPAEFIPAAEESGLIVPIGEWVLRSAVRQAKEWMASGYPPITIAVNLSPVQFRDTHFQDLVVAILEEAALAPEYLELELTEGMAMHDPEKAVKIMGSLHELGVRMSIDDFGTGYSSLNYLKKFKVYKLKIDQTFVRDITTDAEDRAIVAAIISMAKSLGLTTIAEGVETEAQFNFLQKQGCDEMQGYYFSKPLPVTDFEKLRKRYLDVG